MFFDSQLGQEKNAILGVIPKGFRDDRELLLEKDLRLVSDGPVFVLSRRISPELEVMNPRADRSIHVEPSGTAHREMATCCLLGDAHLEHRLVELVTFFDVPVGQLLEHVLLLISQIID